ncbi:response regulator transcription factor [Fuerstiella marisgermanici]|uniref:Transcriptional regulatory protein FixJ n=1 Tax=Fuerstiella marisgermanici TaxID=1891926 RepID=A0A1P8WER3_9PLAN|nr:response regulator [Fuerstiella marisgermanici]APZ92554.1 Transcriptional regulatory protein FixJ [Fuerstiella marisgermanici]
MLPKKGRITRRKPKKAPPPTEFESPRKRRDFTVFLVEDDQGIRASLKEALEEEKLQVNDYMTAMEFYRDYREVVPGVLVLDIRLPGMSGIELQEKLAEEEFPLPVVMISGHADVPMAVRAMKNGAFDFLCKPVKVDDLVAAVGRAYDHYYDVDVDMDDELDATEDSLNRLTGREREVLDHVVDGLSSREIAEELTVSTKTVEAHRARINDKMRADNVAHLIRMCFNFNAAEEV